MQGIYEAAALALRYWFMFAAVIILFGVAGISIKEYKDKRYVMNVAQSSIGYLSVISGPKDIIGENVPLMEINLLGRSKRCDIMFADRSVYKEHAKIHKALSGAVYLERLDKGDISISGRNVENRARLYSMDILCIGNVVTEVHLKEDE
ncbi:MAG: FHA domain-containing protein [Christensenellales bacterium]